MSDISDALNSPGKRTKTHDDQMVFKLPTSAKELIRKASETQGVSDATIVRWALAEWLEKRGYRK